MSEKKDDRIPLAVGAKVWRIDWGDPGDLTEAHAVKVQGETRMSWVLTNGVKIPKTWSQPRFDVEGFRTTPYCLTREAAEAMLLHHNRNKLGSMVLVCTDDAVPRNVAEALGVNLSVED